MRKLYFSLQIQFKSNQSSISIEFNELTTHSAKCQQCFFAVPINKIIWNSKWRKNTLYELCFVFLVRKTGVHESWMLICCCCFRMNDEELPWIPFHTQTRTQRTETIQRLSIFLRWLAECDCVCVCAIVGVNGSSSAGANNQSINGRIFFNFHFRMQSVLFRSNVNVLERIIANLVCMCVLRCAALDVNLRMIKMRESTSKCFANSSNLTYYTMIGK